MKFQKTLFGCLVGVALSMNVNAKKYKIVMNVLPIMNGLQINRSW